MLLSIRVIILKNQNIAPVFVYPKFRQCHIEITLFIIKRICLLQIKFTCWLYKKVYSTNKHEIILLKHNKSKVISDWPSLQKYPIRNIVILDPVMLILVLGGANVLTESGFVHNYWKFWQLVYFADIHRIYG